MSDNPKWEAQGSKSESSHASNDPIPPDPADTKSHSSGHQHSDTPSLAQKIRRLLFTYVFTLTITLLMEGAYILTTYDGRDKVIHSNHVVLTKLNQMQPYAVADAFVNRLTQQHTRFPLQWDAPFNADVARQRLVKHDPLAAFDCYAPSEGSLITTQPAFKAGTLPCYFQSPPGDVQVPNIPGFVLPHVTLASARTPQSVLMSSNADEQARQRADFLVKNARINHLGGPTLSGSPYEILFAFILALPDAYLAIVQALVPKAATWLQIILVLATYYAELLALGWLAERFPKTFGDVHPMLVFFFFVCLPLAVCCGAWLLLMLARGMTLLLGGTWLFLQPMLVLPSTSSAVGTPALLWAGGKISEHHLVEAAMRRLPPAWVGKGKE